MRWGVASALSGSADAVEPETATTAEPSSERRTTALTGRDGTAEAAEAQDAAAGDGEAAGAPAAGGGAPDTGADTGTGTGSASSGTGTGGNAPDGTDPRAEILEDMLNSPQERPPMEPQVSQEDVDAEREAAEAEVEPVEVEFGVEDYPEYGGQP